MSAEEILPTDLILSIFSRLPSKSIARFRCVSKLWASLLSLDSTNFTELFLTQSTTRPRLIFTVRRNRNEWCLYSCPQLQISYKNPRSSLSITAEFYMSLPEIWIWEMSPPVSGLIYFPSTPTFSKPVICNPSTRQLLRLPDLTRVECSYIGYDPIDKQFSVLAISHHSPSDQNLPSNYQILKLGSGEVSWRSLICPLHHKPLHTNICINGILYYIASFGIKYPHKIACFDLNSEEFKFIDKRWSHEPNLLVNFKGKLGGINTKWIGKKKKKSNLELSLWVLEDVEQQEWSEYVYNLPSRLWNSECEAYYIIGLTGKGDIVLALRHTTNPFYVYFFNLEEESLQQVEIKGFEELVKHHSFLGCVDYVEELRVLK